MVTFLKITQLIQSPNNRVMARLPFKKCLLQAWFRGLSVFWDLDYTFSNLQQLYIIVSVVISFAFLNCKFLTCPLCQELFCLPSFFADVQLPRGEIRQMDWLFQKNHLKRASDSRAGWISANIWIKEKNRSVKETSHLNLFHSF